MTRNELKKRLKMIEGTPLPDRITPIKVLRRGSNYIQMEEESTKSYDDFFDFEKDLVEEDLAPSRNLAAAAPGSEFFLEEKELEQPEPSFLTMEEDSSKNEISSLVVMEEIVEEPEEVIEETKLSNEFITDEEILEIMNAAEPQASVKDYRNVKGFDFIQCEYIKNNGEQCKRQAPKGKTICSLHKKMIEKRNEYSINLQRICE